MAAIRTHDGVVAVISGISIAVTDVREPFARAPLPESVSLGIHTPDKPFETPQTVKTVSLPASATETPDKVDPHKGDDHKGDDHKGDDHKGDDHKGDDDDRNSCRTWVEDVGWSEVLEEAEDDVIERRLTGWATSCCSIAGLLLLSVHHGHMEEGCSVHTE
ncbi:hypothetical protein BaRGS_00032073, partial [Batillaria attramentaria]